MTFLHLLDLILMWPCYTQVILNIQCQGHCQLSLMAHTAENKFLAFFITLHHLQWVALHNIFCWGEHIYTARERPPKGVCPREPVHPATTLEKGMWFGWVLTKLWEIELTTEWYIKWPCVMYPFLLQHATAGSLVWNLNMNPIQNLVL